MLSFYFLLFSCDTQWVSWNKFRKNCAVFQKLNACHGGHSVFWNAPLEKILPVSSHLFRLRKKSAQVFITDLMEFMVTMMILMASM